MTAGPPRTITGLTHVSLSVRDLEASRAFYLDVLGLRILRDTYDGEVFDGRECLLLAGSIGLCLQEHAANTGTSFDPTRTGLDHLSFAVPTRPELEAWAAHLTECGIAHSGVKPLPGFGHFIELRDPDAILVELHTFEA